MKNNLVVSYPQKVLALLFGYKGIDLENIDNSLKKKYVSENTEPCTYCGRVHKVGFNDPLKTTVSKNSNAMYNYAVPSSAFICEYCYFNNKNYMKKQNGKHDMADIFIDDKGLKEMDFKTTSKENDLYEIFVNPPKPPYVLMLKEIRGNCTVEMGYCVKPTISKGVIVVNFGVESHICKRELVLECVKEADEILKKFRKKFGDTPKLADDVIFNRATDKKYNYWFGKQLREDVEFMDEYKSFINRYNKSVRFVSKILLTTYIEKMKGN